MSTTGALAESRRLPGRARTLAAALAAVSGRAGWRLWWPLVAWLVAAAVVRIGAAGADRSPLDTSAAGVLVLCGVIGVPLLWWGGARYALTLGHTRGTVFVAATLLTMAAPYGQHAVNLVGESIERSLVGPQGPLVLAVGTSSSPAGQGAAATASWALLSIYLLPLLACVMATVVALLRWNRRGWMVVLLIVVVLAVIVMALRGLSGLGAAGEAGAVALWALCTVGPVVASWFAFRGTEL